MEEKIYLKIIIDEIDNTGYEKCLVSQLDQSHLEKTFYSIIDEVINQDYSLDAKEQMCANYIKDILKLENSYPGMVKGYAMHKNENREIEIELTDILKKYKNDIIKNDSSNDEQGNNIKYKLIRLELIADDC